MDIFIRKLEIKDLNKIPEIDDSFTVDSKLVLSLEAKNQRIEYTVREIPSYEKTYSEDIYKEDQENDLDYSEYVNNLDKIIYLAFMNHQIIGMIILKRNWNSFAYVEDIKVDKQFRQRGVGRKLIEQAKHWAQACEMPGIMLETQSNNVRACKFYENCGFVIGGFDFLVYKGIHEQNDEVAIYWYLRFKDSPI
ncbi:MULTISPECIES: GNAT family N-acetyltransferase [Bacillus]|uniref:GNAT family N-acetyltransferase n=1 Tax=Bacillus TaxID=1386 RepID=UPI0001A13F87|nr:GNAT family N-acetyltransferase [Bacillus pseudomycoides]EEM10803.1 Streptothricin acetyltransferase [Bacillus pseudomycoides]KFN14434.1 acetyltransferase domain protein [Bacillus pseudomycoides]MCR8858057.1 GNAT family N-acetyltransferase [Bacillus pseudomycoides]MDR4189609.1 GNAT family N-acetyltransferase [Bacillus pseudomycoides]PEF26251.1 N-acetyltransferase [Bacillus pseudomycoides]